MTDQNPQPPEPDADVVLVALGNLGSADYATIAIATGLSKIAVSSAITDLTKRGLVTGKSGKYSVAAGTPKPTAGKPAASKTAKSEDPPPPPPPPPPTSAKKPQAKPAGKPQAEPAAGEDAEVVLAALGNLGSADYATIATATGLSKIAVSSAITDLTKRGLVTGKSGKYSVAGATPKKSAADKPTATAPAQAASAAKKSAPKAKPSKPAAGEDAAVVLAALENLGSGNYATIATATGLSKMAVSSAITDLTKRGLVTGQSGEYSIAGATPKKPAAKKPAASQPSQAVAPAGSLADELAKLAALRESGALTATEYTKAKKKLLDPD